MRFSTARVYQLAPPERAKHKLSKIWRKAGDSNAYVPKDPGLAGQWDTIYPSLPGSYKCFSLELQTKGETPRAADCKSVGEGAAT